MSSTSFTTTYPAQNNTSLEVPADVAGLSKAATFYVTSFGHKKLPTSYANTDEFDKIHNEAKSILGAVGNDYKKQISNDRLYQLLMGLFPTFDPRDTIIAAYKEKYSSLARDFITNFSRSRALDNRANLARVYADVAEGVSGLQYFVKAAEKPDNQFLLILDYATIMNTISFFFLPIIRGIDITKNYQNDPIFSDIWKEYFSEKMAKLTILTDKIPPHIFGDVVSVTLDFAMPTELYASKQAGSYLKERVDYNARLPIEVRPISTFEYLLALKYFNALHYDGISSTRITGVRTSVTYTENDGESRSESIEENVTRNYSRSEIMAFSLADLTSFLDALSSRSQNYEGQMTEVSSSFTPLPEFFQLFLFLSDDVRSRDVKDITDISASMARALFDIHLTLDKDAVERKEILRAHASSLRALLPAMQEEMPIVAFYRALKTRFNKLMTTANEDFSPKVFSDVRSRTDLSDDSKNAALQRLLASRAALRNEQRIIAEKLHDLNQDPELTAAIAAAEIVDAASLSEALVSDVNNAFDGLDKIATDSFSGLLSGGGHRAGTSATKKRSPLVIDGKVHGVDFINVADGILELPKVAKAKPRNHRYKSELLLDYIRCFDFTSVNENCLIEVLRNVKFDEGVVCGVEVKNKVWPVADDIRDALSLEKNSPIFACGVAVSKLEQYFETCINIITGVVLCKTATKNPSAEDVAKENERLLKGNTKRKFTFERLADIKKHFATEVSYKPDYLRKSEAMYTKTVDVLLYNGHYYFVDSYEIGPKMFCPYSGIPLVSYVTKDRRVKYRVAKAEEIRASLIDQGRVTAAPKPIRAFMFDFETVYNADGELEPYSCSFFDAYGAQKYKEENPDASVEEVENKFGTLIKGHPAKIARELLATMRHYSSQPDAAHCDNYLWGYNNSRFDNYFLLKFLKMYATINCNTVFMANGAILTMRVMGYKILDLCRFTGCALKRACADFKISSNSAKLELDHEVVQKLYNADKLKFYTDLMNEAGIFQGLREYNIRDCSVLAVIIEKVNSAMCDMFADPKFEFTGIHQYLTSSSMAYSLFQKTLGKKVKPTTLAEFKNQKHVQKPPTLEISNKIRASIVAGRSQIFNVGIWQSILLESGDVVSLYPYVLIAPECYYPCGNICMSWESDKFIPFENIYGRCPKGIVARTEPTLDGDVVDKRAYFHSDKLGYYYCKISNQPDIKIVPLRVKGQALDWTYDGEIEGWYTTVDVLNCIEHNCTVSINAGFYYEDKRNDIFQEFYSNLIKTKNHQDYLRDITDKNHPDYGKYNPTLRAFAKSLQNATPGKFSQNNHLEKVLFTQSEEEYLAFMSTIDKLKVGRDNVVIETIDDVYRVRVTDGSFYSPTSAKELPWGTYVYSYARTHMYRSVFRHIRTEDIFATDTDSAHMAEATFDRIRVATQVTKEDILSGRFYGKFVDEQTLKNLFADADLAELGYGEKYPMQYGMFSYELEEAGADNSVPKTAYYYRPKFYAIEYTRKNGTTGTKIRAKGVKGPNANGQGGDKRISIVELAAKIGTYLRANKLGDSAMFYELSSAYNLYKMADIAAYDKDSHNDCDIAFGEAVRKAFERTSLEFRSQIYSAAPSALNIGLFKTLLESKEPVFIISSCLVRSAHNATTGSVGSVKQRISLKILDVPRHTLANTIKTAKRFVSSLESNHKPRLYYPITDAVDIFGRPLIFSLEQRNVERGKFCINERPDYTYYCKRRLRKNWAKYIKEEDLPDYYKDKNNRRKCRYLSTDDCPLSSDEYPGIEKDEPFNAKIEIKEYCRKGFCKPDHEKHLIIKPLSRKESEPSLDLTYLRDLEQANNDYVIYKYGQEEVQKYGYDVIRTNDHLVIDLKFKPYQSSFLYDNGSLRSFESISANLYGRVGEYYKEAAQREEINKLISFYKKECIKPSLLSGYLPDKIGATAVINSRSSSTVAGLTYNPVTNVTGVVVNGTIVKKYANPVNSDYAQTVAEIRELNMKQMLQLSVEDCIKTSQAPADVIELVRRFATTKLVGHKDGINKIDTECGDIGAFASVHLFAAAMPSNETMKWRDIPQYVFKDDLIVCRYVSGQNMCYCYIRDADAVTAEKNFVKYYECHDWSDPADYYTEAEAAILDAAYLARPVFSISNHYINDEAYVAADFASVGFLEKVITNAIISDGNTHYIHNAHLLDLARCIYDNGYRLSWV